ncbi:uncharacterized protein LOC130895918 isoform X2 [Diorhabda carinulata]|uniref:uncharacterized protein LOC130895918 isoform X2 n=1 Tax=Diorhabda carinulata TaxID=1163345 RepID=UPI0025A236B9|nr:uncharacterized protein LOC130895918 isoform X2 [Diorhabda carinulata]
MSFKSSKVCTCIHFFDSVPDKSIVRENVVKHLDGKGINVAIKDDTDMKQEQSKEKETSHNNSKRKRKFGLRKKHADNVTINLEKMPKKTVKLKTQQVIDIPEHIHDMCSFILRHVEVKGIFKKKGNSSKQEGSNNTYD